MSIKQIIGYGLGFMLSSTLYNIFRGTDPETASGIFGGNFSMLTCLILMAWFTSK